MDRTASFRISSNTPNTPFMLTGVYCTTRALLLYHTCITFLQNMNEHAKVVSTNFP